MHLNTDPRYAGLYVLVAIAQIMMWWDVWKTKKKLTKAERDLFRKISESHKK